MALGRTGSKTPSRKVLAAKADEIDAKARHLRAVGRGLRHAAACRAPSHAQCPTFQRLLKIGAAILRNTRRVRVMLASHHPLRELFATAATRLAALSP